MSKQQDSRPGDEEWRGIATVDELAERLRVGRSTLYEHARDGKIPHFKVGNAIRFDLGQVRIWMLKQMEEKRPAKTHFLITCTAIRE